MASASGSAWAQLGKEEDTALAIPRVVPPGGGSIALPRPLSAEEARLLRRTFQDPAAALDSLASSPLLGHVLADRYLSAAGRPTVEDLRQWLAHYAALPDAPAIHALLVSLLPRWSPPPLPPTLPPFTAAPFGDDVETFGRVLPRNPMLDRAVRDMIRTGQLDRAVHLVAAARGVSAAYASLLRAEIAQAMFSQGRDRDAFALAEAASDQGHGQVGLAPWVAGLAAWRLGRPELARTWFEAAWRAPLSTAGQRAGAAFWAARAGLLTRGNHGPWMQRAAREPRTFYGLLARRVLNQPLMAPRPPPATLGEADVEAVSATHRGARAFALLQVGQPYRAAAELRQLWAEMRDQPGFGRSVLVVARAAGLGELAAQLEAASQPATVHLPATVLRPAGGFRIDPALVYALARLESNFDSAAISRTGARGMMQIMPSTASFVLNGTRGRPIQLHDPATNLDLGQRVLLQLAQVDVVGTDMIRLLAAYNAGHGTFTRWLDTMQHTNDPLLFIASIPGDETRAYVPRALAYTWLYAAQLGIPSPSLDDLAAGRWPRVQVRPGRGAAGPT